jgi:hypothetical protein
MKRPPLRLVTIISFCTLSFGTPLSMHAQSGSPCRPLDDAGQAILNWVRTTATSSDSSAIISRTNLKIPQVAANKVSYVTDSRLCQQAVNAYSTAAGVSGTGRSIYLVKVGTVYVIKDPTVMFGEWWYSMTADSKFRILVKFSGEFAMICV